MEGNYSKEHVAFVSGHTGTGVAEISMVTLSGFLGVLMRNLAIPWLFPAKNFATGRKWERSLKIFLDFALTVVPTLLCFTIFSDRIFTVLLIQTLCSVSLLLFCLCEYWYLYRDKPSLTEVLDSKVDHEKPFFITYTRASRDILKCFPLCAMGLVRLGMVKLSGYHEVVSEYGVHWNFFFTLATVKIISSLSAMLLPLRYCAALVGAFLAVGYQVLLTHFGLKNWIIQDGKQDTALSREGIFDANREGLISVVGFLALYFAGLQLGAFFRKRRGRLKDWFALLGQSVLLMLMFGWLMAASMTFLEPASRRMANLTYIFWMLFLSLQQLSCFILIEVLELFGSAMKWPLFSYSENPFELLEPCLFQRINRRALFHFVVGNLLTGMVNVAIYTVKTDDISAMVVLLVYSYLLSVIVFIV